MLGFPALICFLTLQSHSPSSHHHSHLISIYPPIPIHPITTVVTDGGTALNGLGDLVKGEQLKVKHNETFVHKVTKVNTNLVEGVNAHAKGHVALMGPGCTGSQECFWGALEDFQWRAWYTDGSGSNAFEMIFLALFDVHGFTL